MLRPGEEVPSTFVGADPDRLSGAADRFVDLARQTTGIGERLRRVIGSAAFSGLPAEAHVRMPALVSQLSDVTAEVHSDAQLLKDRGLKQSRKSAPSLAPKFVEPRKYNKYHLGPPTAPTIPHHDAFPYDPNQKPTLSDYVSREKWMARLFGAKLLKPEFKGVADAYYHYWFGKGKPLLIDYEKAYHDDSEIRRWVDQELENARWAAETLYLKGGKASFRMTGDLVNVASDPATEAWQKTIGRHHIWINADVKVEGDKFTAFAIVNERDWYNFNPDGTDLARGWLDRENGRFHTLGWAKEFQTYGSVIRVMTWTMRQPDKAEIMEWKPQPPVPTPGPTPSPSASGSRQ